MIFNFRLFKKKNKRVKGVNHRRAPMRAVKTFPRPLKIGWLARLIARFDRPAKNARA